MTKGEFKKQVSGWQKPGGQKAVLKNREYDRTAQQRPEQNLVNANLMKMMGNVRSVILEDITYKTVEDRDLKLDIFLPRVRRYHMAPTMVFFHGASFLGGDKNYIPLEVLDIINNLRNEGFTVVKADYRTADEVTRFPAPVEDGKDVIRWLRKNFNRYEMDPEKIGVWGMSSGAHMALLVALADDQFFPGTRDLGVYSSQVSYVISWSGVTDLTNWDGSPMPPESIADHITYLMGGTIKDLPDLYKKGSPVAYLNQKSPPVLLLHGTVDPVVPPSQAQRMVTAGQQRGMPVHFFPIENAGHGFFEFMKEGINPTFDDIREMNVTFCKDILGLA